MNLLYAAIPRRSRLTRTFAFAVIFLPIAAQVQVSGRPATYVPVIAILHRTVRIVNADGVPHVSQDLMSAFRRSASGALRLDGKDTDGKPASVLSAIDSREPDLVVDYQAQTFYEIPSESFPTFPISPRPHPEKSDPVTRREAVDGFPCVERQVHGHNLGENVTFFSGTVCYSDNLDLPLRAQVTKQFKTGTRVEFVEEFQKILPDANVPEQDVHLPQLFSRTAKKRRLPFL